MIFHKEGTQSFAFVKLSCTVTHSSQLTPSTLKLKIYSKDKLISMKLNFLHSKMSTTRSQKRKNNQQESTESVSEGFVSPIMVENSCPLDQDAVVAGPSRAKSPRIEGSFLECLKASLKEEITS